LFDSALLRRAGDFNAGEGAYGSGVSGCSRWTTEEPRRTAWEKRSQATTLAAREWGVRGTRQLISIGDLYFRIAPQL